MPFKDPETSRAYNREYKQMQRAGSCQTPGQTQVPLSFRLQTAKDILGLLVEQIQEVRVTAQAGTLEKARTIGYLAGIALRAVEIVELAGRVEALEDVLRYRRNGSP